MAAPLVTIAMPVRNAGRTLAASLRSVLAQTFTDWEFLVIDDGSTDAGTTLVGDIHDVRVRLFRHAESLGLAARLNQAISVARGRFFARMDADDIAYPQRIEAQVKFMLENPGCDLVGCGAVVFDDAGRLRGRFPRRLTHEEIRAHPWRGFFLPHPTWLGKTDWFARHRYLNRYKKTQDQDLLLRTFDCSSFASVDRILLGYRQDRRTVSKSLVGRIYFSRSIAREAWRRRDFAGGLRGLAGQGAKGLADAIAIPLGFDRLLRRREDGPTAAEAAEWAAVWTACTKDGVERA
ncbi:MAG: glycosyltransferase family 2 protein [Burkholderiales bacterium]|nr:glycosyltransferase family 2 protein [Burkholderiales bacterium]